MTTDYDQEFQQYEHKVFGKPISVLTSTQLKSAIAQRGGVIKTSFYYKDDLINRLKELLKEEMMNNNANAAAGILSSNMGSNSLNSSGVGIGIGGNRELNSSGVGLNMSMNGSNANIMTPSSTLSPNNLTLSEKKRVLQSNNDYDLDQSSVNDQIYTESSSPITTTPSKKLNSGFGYYSSNKTNVTTASSGVSSNSNTPTISMQNLYDGDNHKQRALELEHKILGSFSFYFILKRLNYSPALKLTEEFVKFIVLKVMDNDNGVDGLSTKLLAPPLINKVWCEVILNTMKYKELINLIKCEVHHNPILGMNDSLEAKRKRYERCLELYNFYFNSNPTESNPEIWPSNLYLDNDVSSFSFDDDDSIQVINDNPTTSTLTPQQTIKLQQQNEYLQSKLKSSNEKISRLEKEIFRNSNSKINNISSKHINGYGSTSSNEDQQDDIEVVSNINNNNNNNNKNQHNHDNSSDGESNLEMDLDDNNNNSNNNNNNNDIIKTTNGNMNGNHQQNGSEEHNDELTKQDDGETTQQDGTDNQLINIQISGSKGNHFYRIKKHSPIKKIMDKSIKQFGYDSNTVSFLYRNKALSSEDTPLSIGLENDDIIDLIVTDN